MTLCERCLRPIRNTTIADIQTAVCAEFGLPANAMTAVRRAHAQERQIAYLLCRDFTDLSMPLIARHFGGRDHTTILHGINRAREFVETNPVLKSAYERLCERIRRAADA
jgi:chromosomal replication initiator protein